MMTTSCNYIKIEMRSQLWQSWNWDYFFGCDINLSRNHHLI